MTSSLLPPQEKNAELAGAVETAYAADRRLVGILAAEKAVLATNRPRPSCPHLEHFPRAAAGAATSFSTELVLTSAHVTACSIDLSNWLHVFQKMACSSRVRLLKPTPCGGFPPFQSPHLSRAHCWPHLEPPSPTHSFPAADIPPVTILHSDCARANCMLTGSTTVCATAPSAGAVRSRRLPSPHCEPHENVIGHKPTLLAPTQYRESTTLCARTP